MYTVKKNNKLSIVQDTVICYRIINFDNVYFFAEEIITGAIFPLFGVNIKNNFNKKEIHDYKEYSYLHTGKYGITSVIGRGNDIFKYGIYDENSLANFGITKPNNFELDTYKINYENSERWRNLMHFMETQNIYMCGLDMIKENIIKFKNKNYTKTVFNLSSQTLNNTSDYYVSAINLNRIREYGYDLAKQDELCHLLGREEEKKMIIKSTVINRDSTLLIGESGSGKTAIVESLAYDIKNRTSDWLNGKVIFYLNASSLSMGTKYRGMFEDKINELIEFCISNKGKIILFIDEMHVLYGLGRSEESSNDAMNILKPYISKGDICIIGATTKDEYNKYLANDPAFVNRFEIVPVSLLDENMNISIVLDYIRYLENKFNIMLDLELSKRYEVVKFIVKISEVKNQKVVFDSVKQTNPKISKNLFKSAFAEAVYRRSTVVTVDDICMAISECEKFSPTYKKDKMVELRNLVYGDKVKNESRENVKVLALTK